MPPLTYRAAAQSKKETPTAATPLSLAAHVVPSAQIDALGFLLDQKTESPSPAMAFRPCAEYLDINRLLVPASQAYQ